MLQADANLRPGSFQREAFGPFEDGNGGSGEHVFHSKGLKIMKAFDTVEVGVVDLGGLAIHVNERKGGAGDVVFAGSAEAGDDAFGESGFSSAKITCKKDQNRRFDALGEFPAPTNGFLGGSSDELFRQDPGAPG